MKRETALKNLETICERLDMAITDPIQFLFARPVEVWLIGSLLTTKPNPSDLDLPCCISFNDTKLFETKGAFLYHLTYGERTLEMKTLASFATGTKMVRLMPEFWGETFDTWLENHDMPADTPRRLLWKPGMDWKSVIEEVRIHPLPYDAEAEEAHDRLNLTGKHKMEKVWKVILKRQWKNKKSMEDVFETLSFHRGFCLSVTRENFPPEMISFSWLKQETIQRFECPLAYCYWVYEENTGPDHEPDLIRIEGNLTDFAIKTEEAKELIKGWVKYQIESAFTVAGVEMIPITWLETDNEKKV
jgi:hypothetical protein